jgi:hypothetical protein
MKAMRKYMLKEIVQTQRPPAALQNSLALLMSQRSHSISVYQAGKNPSQRKKTSISKVHTCN